MKRKPINRATHTWQGWAVRVYAEQKDMRRIVVLVGPKRTEEFWVHVSNLKPVRSK